MSDDKLFPVIPERRRDVPANPHPLRIPWSVAELAYSVYSGRYGTGQSLERLAERGGFHASEMDEYVPDWRDRASELTALRAKLAEAERERDTYKRLHRHALDCVDQVFQQCTEIPNPILPDFCQVGEDKFRAVIRLANEYQRLAAGGE